VDEIIAFEKQGVVGRYRERVGEAIADVQPRPIAAPAEAAKRVDCDFRRVYKLGVSLPDAPLVRFRVQTADLPQTTEAERLVVQRIGQDIFRAALMDYWGARCPYGLSPPRRSRRSQRQGGAAPCGLRDGRCAASSG
jgi:hypothetical protein